MKPSPIIFDPHQVLNFPYTEHRHWHKIFGLFYSAYCTHQHKINTQLVFWLLTSKPLFYFIPTRTIFCLEAGYMEEVVGKVFYFIFNLYPYVYLYTHRTCNVHTRTRQSITFYILRTRYNQEKELETYGNNSFYSIYFFVFVYACGRDFDGRQG